MEDFSLFSSDAFNRVLGRIGLGYQRPAERVHRRVLAAWLLTWLPIAVLAAFAGVAIGPTPRQTFFFDLAAYAQLFLGLPLLLGAEPIINGHIGRAVHVLWSSGLLADDQEKHFSRGATRRGCERMVDRRRGPHHRRIPLLWGWLGEELRNGVATWHAQVTATGETLTFAGMWAGLFSVPLFLYVM